MGPNQFCGRIEKLAFGTMAGKLKVLGTLIAIGGAMVLTFYKGVEINMISTHVDLLRHVHHGSNNSSHQRSAHHLLGALLAICSSTSNAIWLNIQVIQFNLISDQIAYIYIYTYIF